MPSLSEIGDLSIITPCLVLPGSAWSSHGHTLKNLTQPKGAKREEIESATLNSLTCLKSYELRLSLSAFKFRVAFLFVALAS